MTVMVVELIGSSPVAERAASFTFGAERAASFTFGAERAASFTFAPGASARPAP
ncbi:hypothetical protein [Mycobacterium sp. TY815]|uniref:hypothetical protein n=1 Tax=Mycobacterium sp. TY815 TaxID=3050581 RepID=UPI0027407200|nr:hypothetical protein [Mycobacterium sp. TY815]MDP7705976.1 hypothetical protein [Mycobacterium sp. TY815]